MRSRLWIGLLAGGIGGFLGWFLQEHLIDYNSLIVERGGKIVEVTGDPATRAAAISILCVSGLIGIFLGSVDGIVDRNPRKLVIGMVIGTFAAIVIGWMGNLAGGSLYNLLGGTHTVIDKPGPFAFTAQIIARTAMIGIWGLGIGTGVAIATLHPRRIAYGALGGLIGGSITGFVFDLVATGTQPVYSAFSAQHVVDVGGPGRALCFTGIGALTGFFMGLVEEMLKQAWVKVLAGRNEGKDYILYKSMNLFGRDERCDVPLFGDNLVTAQHAAIRTDGRRHFLLANDTKSGTLVNGQPISPQQEQLLRDGDMIQIASHRILFREKATASRLARPNPDAIQKSGPANLPIPSHLCAFCGSPKDPSGNCKCSVVSTGGSSSGLGYAAGAPLAATPVAQYPGQTGSLSANPGATALAEGFPPLQGAAPLDRLVGLDGSYAGKVFALSGANTEVGRDPGKNIVLSSDSTVSRSHATISHDFSGTVVTDLGSANGTFVNGQRVTGPISLAPGDTVQFGASRFRFE